MGINNSYCNVANKKTKMKTITITSEEVKSQADAVLWHLKTYGTITSYEAIKEYGATRLADIIFKHKKNGYDIDSIPLLRKQDLEETQQLLNTLIQTHLNNLFKIYYFEVNKQIKKRTRQMVFFIYTASFCNS